MGEKKARHWAEIDVMYTIGFVLVLIGHSHSDDWDQFQNTILGGTINFIYTFHMPLFFFIAGFLFLNSDRLKNDGFIKWIKDKFVRLLVPYFFWSLIAMAPKYYLENKSMAGFGKFVAEFAVNPRAGVWGHFWFLPVLFMAYAIFGIGKTLIKNDKCFVYGSFAAFAIFYFMPVKTNILALADLSSYLVFFAVGMIVNRQHALLEKINVGSCRWKPACCMFTVLVCVLLTNLARRSRIFGLLVPLLMIAACWLAATMIKGGKPTLWVGTHNFTLYIFSWFFQATALAVCEKMSMGWIPIFFILLLVGAAGPTAVIFIYDRVKQFHRNPIKLIIGAR